METTACPTSSSDIVAIASAGFMGIAAVIVVGLMIIGRTPPTRVLGVCVIVLLIGAAAQLANEWMGFFVNGKHSVTVSIQPPPSMFSTIVLPNDPDSAAAATTVLQSKPYMWLAAGPSNCRPSDEAYDGKNCPSFDQTFSLISPSDTIDVSVEAIMVELRSRLIDLTQRLKKAQIASTQMAASQATRSGTEAAFSPDLSVKAKEH